MRERSEAGIAVGIGIVGVSAGATAVAVGKGGGHIEDVDHDGDTDLVLHFRILDAGIQCGDTSAILTGVTVEGLAITSFDTISTVGCNSKNEKDKSVKAAEGSIQDEFYLPMLSR